MGFLKNICLVFILLSLCSGFGFGTDVSYDGRAMIINGDRQIILSGSIHYPRSTPEVNILLFNHDFLDYTICFV